MSFDPRLVPQGAEAVTPSDSTAVNYSGLYVGVSGDVAVTGRDGVPVTFANVAAGQIVPMLINKVLLTGTTATSIVGFKA